MLRWSILLMLIGAGVAGCGDSKLETGYKPRALKDSASVRRSYYASPFSPDAQTPALDQSQEMDARRPRPGY